MNKILGESPTSPDIVFITPSLHGGLGHVTKTIAAKMQERGLSVAIWSLNEQLKPETDVPTHVLDASSASASLFELVHLLKAHKPKTVLSASFHLNIITLLAQQITRVKTKIFVVEHTALKQALESISFVRRIFSRLGVRLLYQKASGWIAISKTIADDMSSIAHIKRSDIQVIYNPVISHDLFRKSEEPIQETWQGKLVVSVGRLSPEKDFGNLIRAFGAVQKEVPATLFIIGDGPERDNLEQLIEKQVLSDCVHLLGYRDNPYPYMKKADVYVTSSIREGLPTAIIESLALNTSVVSTDTPSGPREILKDGMYGALVPPQNAQSLSKEILATLSAHAPNVPSEELNKYDESSAVSAYIKALGF